jgi:hypothetical protein
MEMNKISQDKYEALFLGLAEKKKTLFISDDGNFGTNIIKIKNGEKILVKLTDIDSFSKENNLKIGFIKTDLEGADFGALKGMVETIKRDRPVLVLSIYHTLEDFFEMKPFLESIVADLNYKITIEKMCNSGFAEIVIFACPMELV